MLVVFLKSLPSGITKWSPQDALGEEGRQKYEGFDFFVEKEVKKLITMHFQNFFLPILIFCKLITRGHNLSVAFKQAGC